MTILLRQGCQEGWNIYIYEHTFILSREQLWQYRIPCQDNFSGVQTPIKKTAARKVLEGVNKPFILSKMSTFYSVFQ